MRALEAELAAFCGARHAIACSSGTDALLLVLMAVGDRPGRRRDLSRPSLSTRPPRWWRSCGATPVLADVDAATFNLDPASCERAVATAKRLGLKPRAIIPVDLFGLPADHDAIAAVAAAHDLLVLDDAAQAFGATYRGRKLGTLATGDRDQLLSGEAARLLRRRWRGLHRRRRAGRADEKPARARRERRQIRRRAHRHHRPARFDPGRDPAGKAQNLPR